MIHRFHLLPISASTIAPQVDAITFCLLVLSGIVVAGVFGLMLFFATRYHFTSKASRERAPEGNWLLETGWMLAPLGIFMILCIWAGYVYFHMHRPPPGSTEIYVVGKQWMWKFQHPDGTRELNELHVPEGEPIKLVMTSQDVIHSFFVPAFRIKQDVLPDRLTSTWFQATKPGVYHLFCTQYCGTAHADMRGKVIVMRRADYQKWLESGISSVSSAGPAAMASRGGHLFRTLGCISCHDTGGVMAPMLDGLYGSKVGLSDGTTVIADENYIRESILYPRAKIVQGYKNIMPSFLGVVSDEDLLDLIAFIKQYRAEGRKP